MAGGLNTYGYVGGNPLNVFDFYGLSGDSLPPNWRDGSGRTPRTGNPINGPYKTPPTVTDKIGDSVLDQLLKRATGIGGLITKSGPAVFVSLMVRSDGLGGCDENGNCSDMIQPPPDPEMCYGK